MDVHVRASELISDETFSGFDPFIFPESGLEV